MYADENIARSKVNEYVRKLANYIDENNVDFWKVEPAELVEAIRVNGHPAFEVEEEEEE